MNRLTRKIYYLKTQYIYSKRFYHVGRNSIIIKPLQLDYVKSIYIHNNVSIYHFCWLISLNPTKNTIIIDDNCTIGHYFHLVANNMVHIGKDVLIADKVFVTDCTHDYSTIEYPISKQKILQIGDVNIGDGSWLGENVCILGASIGKHSIIGANSVVTSDIPDYVVAAGNPAKIIKKFDFEKNKWTSYEENNEESNSDTIIGNSRRNKN